MAENKKEACWYVVHTYSGYENKVKDTLEKSVENNGMQDLILEVRVPMEEVVEIRNGKRVKSTRKVYPGYVLVHMIETSESWYVVRNTRGVTGFVGPDSKPVPLTDAECKEYQKRRDAFNHMTVMYKKSAVLAAGSYQHCPLMEDTLLWVNMFKNGAVAMNIDDFLVNARIGKGMYERRGGWAYYKKYKQARKRIYETGYISWWDYEYTLLVQLVVALMPNKLRGFVFKKILHR